MKTKKLFCWLLAACTTAVSPLRAQVDLEPNAIQGQVAFDVSNLDLLDFLDGAGQEGIESLYLSAYSVPPDARSASSDILTPSSRLQSTYELSVDASPAGIRYVVYPRVSVLHSLQTYYFRGATSGPVVAGGPALTLNFSECPGRLTVHFIDELGLPLTVAGGTLIANEIASASEIARLSLPTTGVSDQQLLLRGNTPAELVVSVSTGTSTFTDRIRYTTTVNVEVPCDGESEIEVVIPTAGTLGRAFGRLDVVGEFEATVDGYDAGDYPDYSSVVASFGPFGNVRYGATPGINGAMPASGLFILSNLVSTTLVPDHPGYLVYADLFLRTNAALSYFRTPALGAGSNPGLTVAPGQSINLSNLFVIEPGYLQGRVTLRGPAESLGRASLLRGVRFASDDDTDRDGLADGIGTYSLYSSVVGAAGVDRAAPGANFTSSYGYGSTGFKGDFNPVTSSYAGTYDLPLGGLLSEPSLWNRSILTVLTQSDPEVPDEDYYYGAFTITDTAPKDEIITPGAVTEHDAAYCVSELCVTFRSTEPFYSPSIRFSQGGHTTVDFQGLPASYSVYVDPAFGIPREPATASTQGRVVLYLPQGRYRLTPYVTPSNSIYATISGEAIDVTVGCGQRICVDTRLQLNITLPACAGAGEGRVTGQVNSFGTDVTRVTWQLDQGTPVEVCADCGVDPRLDFPVTLPPGSHTLTVRAEDALGGVSTVTGSIEPDTTPPVLPCVDPVIVTAERPCGSTALFNPTASDSCDPAPVVICTPPAGTLFPIGQTPVNCVATDASGNTGTCTFTVQVVAGQEFLDPAIAHVSPALIGTAGGTHIVITGTGFTIDDEVLIDGTALEYGVFVSTTEIQGRTPALSAGSHTVQIRRCGQIAATLPQACTSETLPSILSLEPRNAFAAGGNTILIRGTNFLPSTQVRIAFPGGGPADNLVRDLVVSDDGSTITGIAPPLPSGQLFGPRDVIAFDARGQDVLLSGLTYLPNEVEVDPQVLAIRRLEADSTVPAEFRIRNGFPIAIGCRVSVPGNNHAERALAFVQRYRELFRLLDPGTELAAAAPDPDNLKIVRLQQSYLGVPVIGGELSLFVSGTEVLDAIGGLLPTGLMMAAGLEVRPTISASQAVGLARERLGLPDRLPLDAPTLGIFDRCLLQAAVPNPRLVWTVFLEGAPSELYIDAHNGETAFANPMEHSHGGELEGADVEVRDAANRFDASSKPACYGSPQVLLAGDENGLVAAYTGDPRAVATRTHLLDAYRFFHRNFGWHSYDGASAQLRAYVHATVANAQWDAGCQTISVSDAYVDFEILLHELVHGILGSTSKLRYFLESGALNESYCDVMAVLADRQAGANNWTLGENRIGNTNVIRDIPNNPIRFWGQFNGGDTTETPANDYGKVHRNSGIPNYAAYILATKHRLKANGLIPPMTEFKVTQLKFAALKSLTTDATFMAARTREITLATEWARNGEFGFTEQDINLVRLSWADVGVGYELDTDSDGIPDDADNCPFRANPLQENSDFDNVGDACDNCRETTNPDQADMDQDNIGDACDPDIDGDGCRNEVDQHPNSSTARSGTFISATCSERSGFSYEFEGGDTDRDGRVDCEDFDDDNDGVPDDLDPCPFIFGGDGNSCREVRDCPLIRNDWWRVCVGGGCNIYQMRFVDRINPDPTRVVVVDQVQIVNQTIYLQPALGNTVQQLTRALAPRLAGGGFAPAADGPDPSWRAELWTRPTDGQPAQLVAVIGDYNPATLETGALAQGSWLAFTPGSISTRGRLDSTWNIGGDPSTAAQDSDGDGLPDGWEIGHGLDRNNPADALTDIDGDGVSNRDEYVAGTDPRNAASVTRIADIRRSPAGLVISLVAPAGSNYRLERRTSLSTGDWIAIGPTVLSQGGTSTFTDTTGPTEAQGFYRVRLVPE